MAIFLKNADYIDWKNLKITKTHLKVSQNSEQIQRLEHWPGPNEMTDKDRIIDCDGKLVTRSFVCAHHHIYSALARGMGAPRKNPLNFYEILKYIWWTLDKCLDQEMIRISALLTALYCIKNGVTFVIDHHASPFSVPDSLFTIAEALDQCGLSHLLCYELSDRDGDQSRRQGLAESESYLKSGKQGLIGLHASFTVGDQLLNQAVDLAVQYQSGIHIHVAEDQVDQEKCLVEYGMRVIPRLKQTGVLTLKKTLLAHCLHLDTTEKELLQQAGTYVIQNPESNLNNNVGVLKRQDFEKQLLLGTDGLHSDMLRSAKTAYFLGQTTGTASPLAVYEQLRRVHLYLQENGFKGDGENNLIVLDYDSPTPITSDNFLSHFIFGLESRHIESVIASGRLIMHQKKVLSIDEPQLLAQSKSIAPKLWQKMAGFTA